MIISQNFESGIPTPQLRQLTITELPESHHSMCYEVSALGQSNHNPNSSIVKESNLICWNCRDMGYRYHDSTKVFLEVFCFGCGNRGVRKPNCFICKKRALENFNPNVSKNVGMTTRSEQTTSHLSPNLHDSASNTERHNKFK